MWRISQFSVRHPDKGGGYPLSHVSELNYMHVPPLPRWRLAPGTQEVTLFIFLLLEMLPDTTHLLFDVIDHNGGKSHMRPPSGDEEVSLSSVIRFYV